MENILDFIMNILNSDAAKTIASLLLMIYGFWVTRGKTALSVMVDHNDKTLKNNTEEVQAVKLENQSLKEQVSSMQQQVEIATEMLALMVQSSKIPANEKVAILGLYAQAHKLESPLVIDKPIAADTITTSVVTDNTDYLETIRKKVKANERNNKGESKV